MLKALLKPSKNTSKNSKYIKKTDYESFGRFMAEVYETGYIDKWRMFKYSFMKGVVAGFGGVIGATIVVGLMLWVLSFFDSVPFVNRVVNQFENSVETKE